MQPHENQRAPVPHFDWLERGRQNVFGEVTMPAVGFVHFALVWPFCGSREPTVTDSRTR